MFPVYRKYANHHSYFIVTSASTWIEFKKTGSRYIRYEFTATQLPERNFIQDMLALTEGFEESSKQEIENIQQ